MLKENADTKITVGMHSKLQKTEEIYLDDSLKDSIIVIYLFTHLLISKTFDEHLVV